MARTNRTILWSQYSDSLNICTVLCALSSWRTFIHKKEATQEKKSMLTGKLKLLCIVAQTCADSSTSAGPSAYKIAAA